ncbi:hypothetical protein Bca101_057504 [Brassica carinata]
MFRPKKKKELSLVEEFKELELLEEGEMVDLHEENDDLLEENSLSMIVRWLNPSAHKVGGLVKALPPIWGLEDTVQGRGVGTDRVQFIFQSERDLHHVLTRELWFINGWIVVLDQWTPTPAPDFLCKIPFWIRIRGLPIHLLKRKAVESLVGPLGKVENVELHAKNSSSVEYVRAQVWINTDEPLQFCRIARFKSGEVIPTELEYKRLIKVCFLCKRLTHDQTRCPFQPHMQPKLQSRGREVPGRDQRGTGSEVRKRLHGGSSSSAVAEATPQARKTITRRTTKTSDLRRTADPKGKSVVGAPARIRKQKEATKTPEEKEQTPRAQKSLLFLPAGSPPLEKRKASRVETLPPQK